MAMTRLYKHCSRGYVLMMRFVILSGCALLHFCFWLVVRSFRQVVHYVQVKFFLLLAP